MCKITLAHLPGVLESIDYMHITPRLLACLLPAALAACGASHETPPERSAVTQSRSAPKVASAAPTTVDYHDVIQRFYVAYFGRPADVSGLDYWSVQYQQLGLPSTVAGFTEAYSGDATVRLYVDVFGASKESQDLYPGDNASFISAVYRNLFNREPDAVGRAFWIDKLDRGLMTRPVAAFQIMRGAQLSDIQIIENKVAVAKRFSAALNADVVRDGYDAPWGPGNVRAMLSTVGASTAPLTFDLMPTIFNLVAGSGPANHYLSFEYGPNHLPQQGIMRKPGGPTIAVAPPGDKALIATLSYARLYKGVVSNPMPDSFTFWVNKRIYRQALQSHFNDPDAIIVSTLSQEDVCAAVPRTFADYDNPVQSTTLFSHRGPDGICNSGDDYSAVVRMNMDNSTAALKVKEPVFAMRDANGGISGYLVKDGFDIKRTDVNFANAVKAFTLEPDTNPASVSELRNVRQIGNVFIFRTDLGEYVWNADITADGSPIRLAPVNSALRFASALAVDTKEIYIASTGPGLVQLQRYVAAAHRLEDLGTVKIDGGGDITFSMTPSHYVIGDGGSGSVWVMPRLGGAASQLYKAAGKPQQALEVHLAGNRIWFPSANGVVSLNTDGSSLLEYPGARLAGCVYRSGTPYLNDNDVCASMLLLENDSILRGYAGTSGKLDVTYGAVPAEAASDTYHQYRRANPGRALNGEGMLLTRYRTHVITNGRSNVEHWHFIAGTPGLTQVAMP